MYRRAWVQDQLRTMSRKVKGGILEDLISGQIWTASRKNRHVGQLDSWIFLGEPKANKSKLKFPQREPRNDQHLINFCKHQRILDVTCTRNWKNPGNLDPKGTQIVDRHGRHHFWKTFGALGPPRRPKRSKTSKVDLHYESLFWLFWVILGSKSDFGGRFSETGKLVQKSPAKK